MDTDVVIRQLSTLLRETGDQIKSNKSQLTLTGTYLRILVNSFEKLTRNPSVSLKTSGGDHVEVKRNERQRRDLEFLHDFFKSTPALKVDGLPKDPESDVIISDFPVLQVLSVRKIPIERIKGLKALRERLTRLSCQRSYTFVKLKSLLSECGGGDEASELSWPHLTELDVSYNAIEALDDSLKLCGSLQMLDVSHNKILEDQGGLQYLHELCFVNLSYNRLESLPSLSRCACLRLTKLVLRNNNLGSVNGIEFLTHLEELDLSFNCLISHGLLSPLSLLNQLTKLYLRSNPFAHHPSHRCLTATKLSPHVDPDAISVDGVQLSASERRYLPKPDFYGINSPSHNPAYLAAAMRPPTPIHTASSHQRGQKSRSRARPVDIGDDDTTDEKTAARKLLFSSENSLARSAAKREEIENLRKELGETWLETQNASTVNVKQMSSAESPGKVIETEVTGSAKVKSVEAPPPAEDVSESKEGVEEATDLMEDLYGDASETFLVYVSDDSDDEDAGGKGTSRFITITERFIVEKRENGKVLGQPLDYQQCLEKAVLKTSVGDEVEEDCDEMEELHQPVLYLEFSHTRLDRRKRRYVMESWPQSLDVLKLLRKSIASRTAVRSIQPRYECLICSAGFVSPLGLDGQPSSCIQCPNCHNSDRIIQISSSSGSVSSPIAFRRPLASQLSTLATSQPLKLPAAAAGTMSRKPEAETETDGQSSVGTPSCFTPPLDSEGVRMDVFARISRKMDQPVICQTSNARDSAHSRSHSRDLDSSSNKNLLTLHSQTGSKESIASGTSSEGVLSSTLEDAVGRIDLEDVETPPHQLKLHYDLQLFQEKQEEFVCHFKCGLTGSAFRDSSAGVMVVSSKRCYFCLCKGEMRMDSCDWLFCKESHTWESFNKLVIGLEYLYLMMEFSSFSCFVIFLDSRHCKKFLSHLKRMASGEEPRYKVAAVCPRTMYNLRTQLLNLEIKQSLSHLGADLKSVLQSTTDLIQDHRRFMSTYSRTFIGSKFVTWLTNNGYASGRHQAGQFGQTLLDLKILQHASSQSVFEDNSSLFSFVHRPPANLPYRQFILCQRGKSLEDECESVALVITTQNLYLSKMALRPPEPFLISHHVDKQQFTDVQMMGIDSINNITVYQSNPLQLSLDFFEEDVNEGSSVWHLMFETLSACQDVQVMIRQLWEDVFNIPKELVVL